MFDDNQFQPSYYEASVKRPTARPPLLGEETADICVVGGGLTGCNCALELAKKGFKVIVLEARQIGWGASGRSGGQILHGYSSNEFSNHAKVAQVSEKMLFNLSLEAIDLVRNRIKEYDIDCDFQSGYAEAAVQKRHFDEIKIEVEKWEKEFNYTETKILEKIPFREIIASRSYVGGYINDRCGHLHPLKYTLGIASAMQKEGAKLYEQTAVTKITKNTVVEVQTEKGMIKCQTVVLACNAHLNLFPKIGSRIMPVGTYIGATKPLGDQANHLIADHRCVCNTNFVLDYFRCSADQRLLFGGRVSYSKLPPLNLHAAMKKRMISVFPQLEGESLDYVWGGYVAITLNRFPDIGRHNHYIYYAQGFSGHGMAFTGLAGKMIAEAISQETTRFDVFDRIKHRAFPGKKLFRTPLLVLAMLYYRFRDWL